LRKTKLCLEQRYHVREIGIFGSLCLRRAGSGE